MHFNGVGVVFFSQNRIIQMVNEAYSLEYLIFIEGRRGRDRMVVGLTTTYAINAYYH